MIAIDTELMESPRDSTLRPSRFRHKPQVLSQVARCTHEAFRSPLENIAFSKVPRVENPPSLKSSGFLPSNSNPCPGKFGSAFSKHPFVISPLILNHRPPDDPRPIFIPIDWPLANSLGDGNPRRHLVGEFRRFPFILPGSSQQGRSTTSSTPCHLPPLYLDCIPREVYQEKSIDIEWSAPAPGYNLYMPPNSPDAEHHGDPPAAQDRRVVRLTAFHERSGTVQQYETIVPSALCIGRESMNH